MINATRAKEKPQMKVPIHLAERLALGEITLREFVGLDRKTLYSIAEKGHQLLRSGKLKQAKTIYQGLVKADPHDSVFHCHLAAVLHKQGEMNAALKVYDHSLKLNHANVDSLSGRGEIYFHKGRLGDAVTDLKKAIQLDPQAKRPATARARALILAVAELARKKIS